MQLLATIRPVSQYAPLYSCSITYARYAITVLGKTHAEALAKSLKQMQIIGFPIKD